MFVCVCKCICPTPVHFLSSCPSPVHFLSMHILVSNFLNMGVIRLDSKCFHPLSYLLSLSSSFIVTNGAPSSVVMHFITFFYILTNHYLRRITGSLPSTVGGEMIFLKEYCSWLSKIQLSQTSSLGTTFLKHQTSVHALSKSFCTVQHQKKVESIPGRKAEGTCFLCTCHSVLSSLSLWALVSRVKLGFQHQLPTFLLVCFQGFLQPRLTSRHVAEDNLNSISQVLGFQSCTTVPDCMQSRGLNPEPHAR